MAEGAVIGALRVVIGADTAKLEENLDKAGKSIAGFGKTAGVGVVAAGTLIADALLKIGGAVASSMQGAIDKIEEVGKAAQRTGSSVEEFSKLAFAANKVGVSTEDLATSLARLNRNIAEIAAGNKTSDAAKAFQAMGISVRDSKGNVKDAIPVFNELAGKFVNYAEGANKVALAHNTLGRSGEQLLPVLNLGAAGIAKYAAEMEALGIVIDDKTFQAAKNFNKEVGTISKVFDSVIFRITQEFLPTLQMVSKQFADTAKSGKEWEGTAFAIDGTVKVLTSTFIIISSVLGYLVEKIGLAGKAIALLVQGEFTKAFETIGKGGSVFDLVGEASKRVAAVWGAGEKDAIDYNAVIQQMEASLLALSKVQLKAPDVGISPLTKALQDLQFKTLEVQGTFNKFPAGFAELAKSMDPALASGQKLTTQYVAANAELRKLLAGSIAFQQANITAEFLTPWQLYEQEMIRLNATFPEGQRQVEAYGLKAQQIGLKLAQTYITVAQSIVSPIASAFKDLASMNKKYATAAKAAAIGEAIVNTALAVTKALTGGVPPYNYVAAAAVAAAGAVQIAKIASTDFATGGSFKVGGGMTGVDSQLVQFNASPGEMVDIRRPGQQAEAPTTVNLALPRTDTFFSAHVREMVDALNRAAPDGYVLKVA